MSIADRESTAQSDDWRAWNYVAWADHLLEHYFARSADNEEPVRSLVVAGADLARAAGEPTADPDEVADRLVEMTVRAAQSKANPRDFWRHAEERSGLTTPVYLAHLVVACLVAADATDPTENSFIQRLADRTAPANGDSHLEAMPSLWTKLKTWLEQRPDTYRPLVLPNPGGWRRIGHTIQLAFPGRADQRRLASCLDARGLRVEDPPLGPVLNVIALSSSQFSIRFREELASFQSARNEGISLDRLHGEPFWSAVRSVVGVYSATTGGQSVDDWLLAAEDDGYALDLRLLARGPQEILGVPAVPTQDSLGEWDHVMILEESTERAPALIMTGALRVGHVSSMVAGGLVAFSDGDLGSLEIATRRTLGAARVALIRDDLLDEVRRRFGSQRWRSSAAHFGGWSLVRGFQLQLQSDEELSGTALDRCWLLRLSPTARSLRLVDGVSVEGSWLGFAPLLPALSAQGAVSAEILVDQSWTPLLSEDDRWLLPYADLDGEVEVRCSYPDQVLHRVYSFVRTPSSEAFKGIHDLGKWTVEGAARALSLADEGRQYGPAATVVADVERAVYLESHVGRFCSSPRGAAWEVRDFAGRRTVKNLIPLGEVPPTNRSTSGRDRRLWRRQLDRALPAGGDTTIAKAVARIVRVSDRDLPTIDPSAPRLSQPLAVATEHQGVSRSVAAMAAVFNRRATVDRKLLLRILVNTMDLPYDTARRVLRSWQECGLIKELVNLHWSNRCFTALAPSFEITRTHSGYRASLRGLTLRATLRDAEAALGREGIEFESTQSLSPFTPRSIVAQFEDLSQFEGVAVRLRITTRNLRANPFAVTEGRDLRGNQPGNYEQDDYYGSEDTSLKRWWKAGAPAFWTVETERFATWTHFEDAARFWSAAFVGADIVAQTGDTKFDVARSYLPLSAAIWLTSAGGVLSGPTDLSGTRYSYGTPTTALANSVRNDLQQFIESHLPDLALKDTTCTTP